MPGQGVTASVRVLPSSPPRATSTPTAWRTAAASGSSPARRARGARAEVAPLPASAQRLEGVDPGGAARREDRRRAPRGAPRSGGWPRDRPRRRLGARPGRYGRARKAPSAQRSRPPGRRRGPGRSGGPARRGGSPRRHAARGSHPGGGRGRGSSDSRSIGRAPSGSSRRRRARRRAPCDRCPGAPPSGCRALGPRQLRIAPGEIVEGEGEAASRARPGSVGGRCAEHPLRSGRCGALLRKEGFFEKIVGLARRGLKPAPAWSSSLHAGAERPDSLRTVDDARTLTRAPTLPVVPAGEVGDPAEAESFTDAEMASAAVVPWTAKSRDEVSLQAAACARHPQLTDRPTCLCHRPFVGGGRGSRAGSSCQSREGRQGKDRTGDCDHPTHLPRHARLLSKIGGVLELGKPSTTSSQSSNGFAAVGGAQINDDVSIGIERHRLPPFDAPAENCDLDDVVTSGEA